MSERTFPLSSALAGMYLEAFIKGDPAIRERLPRLVHLQLVAMAREVMKESPDDLLEEVVTEVWCAIISRPVQYDRKLGSAWGFFRNLMWNAARTVRAAYAPPGSPRRQRGATVTTPPTPPLEEVQDSVSTGPSQETSAEVRQILSRADAQVGRTLYLVHGGGYSLSELAEETGTSRFTLARAMERFCAAQRAA